MTNEEIQRTMEFIIQRQEQFAENMGKAEARMARMETAFGGLFNLIAETAKAQKELTESQRDLTKRVDEIATAQAQTDERLSALINTVERYISEGRNGKA